LLSECIGSDVIVQYGEKLLLLSQAASPIIAVLPAIPSSSTSPYTGRDTTAAVRASLQRALDNYKTGHIHLPPQPAPGDLSRSDTQSFGESHASELSSIYTEGAGAITPSKTEETDSTVINPQDAPAPISAAPASPAPASVAAPAKEEPTPSNVLPAVTPTIAATGIPLSAGPGGPGPASGSLSNIKAEVPAPTPAPTPSSAAPAPVAEATPKHETAIEEKKRLAALYSSPVQSTPPASTPAPTPATTSTPGASSSTGQPQTYESAEEEKRRLEREEREKALRGNAPPDVPSKDVEEELPPYQEPM
jgi:hypothetical protein